MRPNIPHNSPLNPVHQSANKPGAGISLHQKDLEGLHRHCCLVIGSVSKLGEWIRDKTILVHIQNLTSFTNTAQNLLGDMESSYASLNRIDSRRLALFANQHHDYEKIVLGSLKLAEDYDNWLQHWNTNIMPKAESIINVLNTAKQKRDEVKK